MYVPRYSTKTRKSTLNEAIADDTKPHTKRTDKLLDLDAYISRRDFGGALTLLRLHQQDAIDAITFPTDQDPKHDAGASLSTAQQATWWLAYCHFQIGDYGAAAGYFDQLLASVFTPLHSRFFDTWRLSRACCLYYLGDYQEAEREAHLSTRLPLCNRLLYLLAHHRKHDDGRENVLIDRYKQLSPASLEDQLALAFVSVTRRNYQEAVEIYKGLVLQHRDTTAALHVYLAMCYFHLDYYDVSLELLAVYLESHRDSFVASNLKASNQLRLYSGVEATQELENFRSRNHEHACNQEMNNHLDPSATNAVLSHNLAIFQDSARPPNTTTAIKAVLAPLLGRFDEVRTNLVLAYLHRREYREAFELVEDLDAEPATSVEQITKAILHAKIGEQTDSKEHIFLAEKYFHVIGVSPSECDTIPGRQCKASYHFLRREFQDANVYLNSIATYLISSDAFNWNYGLSLAACERFNEAEEVLLRVQSVALRAELEYCSWLARVYIQNGRHAGLAWELYLGMENTADAFKLLKLVANDYYKAKNFYYAVKAFDVLERLDPDPEYWEAKRGACVGFFQQIALGDEPLQSSRCEEVLKLLAASKNVVESNQLTTMLTKWVHSITV